MGHVENGTLVEQTPFKIRGSSIAMDITQKPKEKFKLTATRRNLKKPKYPSKKLKKLDTDKTMQLSIINAHRLQFDDSN